MTSATTATRRATGLTSAPGVDEQPNQTSQQQPGPSSKTVKYNFSSFIPNNKNFELEQDISTVEFKVDNLKRNLSFWKNTLHANNFVLNVIEFGYLIPFFETPPSVFLRNNASSLSNAQFVETAIAELLSTGVITEYKDQIPSVVNPLSVSINAKGKHRLILDLRHVNKYNEKRKFKFEGVPEAMNFIQNPGFMVKFDLKSGYHHVPVHEDHQQFLGFSCNFPDGPRYFVFRCLPFGLSTAGHVFSKVLRPLVKHWRSQGLRMVVYLDDGWGIETSYENCKTLSKIVKHDLLSAGFFINSDKSIWNPTKNLTWLGFIWNLVDLTLEIPQEKLDRFKSDINSISIDLNLTARKLARITGKIIAFLPSFGNICRIMSRNMLMLIANSDHWDAKIILSDEAKFELDFWLRNCDSLPSVSFLTQKYIPDRIVYTDASSFACADFLVKNL